MSPTVAKGDLKRVLGPTFQSPGARDTRGADRSHDQGTWFSRFAASHEVSFFGLNGIDEELNWLIKAESMEIP